MEPVLTEFNLEHVADNLSLTDGKKYLEKYIVPLTNGNHILLGPNGTMKFYNKATLKDVYFNRISKELNNYYFYSYKKLRTLTCEFGQPRFYENYINTCPSMLHDKESYENFHSQTQQGVDIMLKFIKEVICGDQQDSYDFVVKWIANMLQGNKNSSCLYLKSAVQGIGKSTLTEFLMNYVIGEKLCLETGSGPLVSQFNKILESKLLVVFEELENFSISSWQAISSKLKRYISSDVYTIEQKGVDVYDTKNINNYILISNNDAIKDDEGRRYFILDLSTKYEKDHKYFDCLRKNCFNLEVGKAFYNYMLNIDTQEFNPQAYPDTKSKLDSIAKRLDSVYMFLKDDYILKKLSIDKITVNDLHVNYTNYCAENNIKRPYNKIDFNKRMSEINVAYYKSNSKNIYNVSYDDLLAIAKKRYWIHSLDDFNEEDKPINQPDHKDLEILELKRQIEELKHQLSQKNESLIIPQTIPEIINEDIVEVDQDELDYRNEIKNQHAKKT